MFLEKKCFIVGLILAIAGGLFISPAQSAEIMKFSALEGSGPQEVAKLVLHEAYKRIGFSVQFITLPGERALIESNAGRTDGEVSRIGGIEKKYKNMFMVPVPITQLDGVAFTNQPALAINGWDSLKSYRIGAFIGSKFVEKNTVGMEVNYLPGIKNLFSMQERGRLDLFIIPYLSGLRFIKNNSLVGFRALSPPLTTIKLYHYLNNKHLKLLPRITKALEALERENRIQILRDDYVAELKKK